MTKLRNAISGGGVRTIIHWCPGCEQAHSIRIAGPSGPTWTFNGDYERPTFAPSILCFTEYDEDADSDIPVKLPNGQRKTLCHYFIRDGKIEFCADSPHKFAGQTVDLPEWPYASGAYGGVEDT